MPRELLLPELAESVVEGEILKWLVQEGEMVVQNQPVAEVMTDKATVELPSPFSGILEKHLAKVGDVVAIETAIALFSDEAGGEQTKASDDDDGSSLSLFTPSEAADNGPVIQVRKNYKATTSPKSSGPYGRVLAVPAARKLARDLDIDINEVAGSGPNGRVRVDDVKAHKSTQAPSLELEERIAVRGLRRAISQQMTKSHLEAVRTLHVDEADVSVLVELRNKLKPIAAEQDIKLSY
ncbi:MAG TPA: 2-oxo acid dehydrogenase subunit E2, partial [Trueperaceae bacterium]|nr:2-oxo acid dehydrogenase subunit E2 [Trueperaceae bacterium]